tara:strand:+ start:8141 stop:8539 length:399 start_codon:yes stop_codon:yes gene_type:complete
MMKHLTLIALVSITGIFPFALAGNQPEEYPSETEAVKALAAKYEGEVEHRLWDLTRVDLLTEEYAIEADWSYKWAEGIGQSLYYAEVTGKKPAVMILVKDIKKETRYIYRLQTVAAKHDIKVFIEVIEPETD